MGQVTDHLREVATRDYSVDAAEAEARLKGWKLVFVVSDAEGTPIYVRRMDGVPKRNYDVAMNKISTVIKSGMHTVDYAAAVKAGLVRNERLDHVVESAGNHRPTVDPGKTSLPFVTRLLACRLRRTGVIPTAGFGVGERMLSMGYSHWRRS